MCRPRVSCALSSGPPFLRWEVHFAADEQTSWMDPDENLDSLWECGNHNRGHHRVEASITKVETARVGEAWYLPGRRTLRVIVCGTTCLWDREDVRVGGESWGRGSMPCLHRCHRRRGREQKPAGDGGRATSWGCCGVIEPQDHRWKWGSWAEGKRPV